ncbi:MAG: hypothetical protein GOV15_02855, partial [Candidatus Diapherotrites archaeon]|nr:hypothetical protein [Candidatus Diapherotrites archaeon]
MYFVYSAFLFLAIALISIFVLRSNLSVSWKVIGLGFVNAGLPLILNLAYDLFVVSVIPSYLEGVFSEMMGAFVNVLWFWSVALPLMFWYKASFKRGSDKFGFAIASSSAFALLMSLFFFLPLIGSFFATSGQAGFFEGVSSGVMIGDASTLEVLVIDLSQLVRLIIIYFLDLMLILLAFR